MDITYFINALEVLTALLATFHLKKYKFSNENYFFWFLWFTVLVETLGGVLSDVFSLDTYWLYNFYMVVSFMFYLFWYHQIIQKRILKKVIQVFIISFMMVVLWDFVFRNEQGYQEYTFITGALFTMACTIFHFRQLLYSEEILILKNKLSFWISTGLLLFNMGMIPLMLLSDYFEFVSNRYYLIIIILLNIILYGCYIIGFQWAKEKYNRF